MPCFNLDACFGGMCFSLDAYDISILFLVFLVSIKRYPLAVKRYTPEDESFLREVVFPEEDRHLFTSAPWTGEYRWFRSTNVVPLEHWRRVSVNEDGRPAAA